MPVAAKPSPALRNRAETEARLRRAVEELLVERGFASLTPSAIGRQAGVDKMLIYRYFENVPGLVRAIAFAPDFFPSFEDMCGGLPREAVRAMRLPERAAHIVTNNLRALLGRPVVLELMVWELVERNELTAIMEEAREELGLRIMAELFDDARDPAQLRAFAALLTAGVTYLALRRRKIRWYSGVDLKDPALPDVLHDAIAQMAAGLNWQD
ncbi:TetR/AcrR family transcriptional regulator [Novosphingobium sp.]|uniref:TetR/AcrR family transcriptional regulator n=1 Tax=Novosphingobium sp. TaxID=1874826 RepID=UPI003BAA5531